MELNLQDYYACYHNLLVACMLYPCLCLCVLIINKFIACNIKSLYLLIVQLGHKDLNLYFEVTLVCVSFRSRGDIRRLIRLSEIPSSHVLFVFMLAFIATSYLYLSLWILYKLSYLYLTCIYFSDFFTFVFVDVFGRSRGPQT